MRSEPKLEIRPRRKGSNGLSVPALADQISDPFPLQSILTEDGRADPGQVELSDADLLSLYSSMVLSRFIDERMIAMQRQGRISFYIGSIGEEATIFGSARAMAPTDWIFPCYREHGAALLRGMPLEQFICELFGNAGDAMLGHQMPCHEAWRQGLYASISSPIGTQIPQAVGAAWAARIKRDEMVSLVYFGDGATSSSDFHTGLTFAGVHRVPVVFLCRNNGWAISVPRERQTAAETIAHKAPGYGVRGERVDGNDLIAVHRATSRARERAIRGEGPTLIECVTYRMEGHSTSDDPRVYRTAEAVEPWRKKDPILRMKAFLQFRGLMGEDDDAKLRARLRDDIQSAVKQAEEHPAKPPLESLFEGVYEEPLRQQREQLQALLAVEKLGEER
ncbi:MAG TPA: thiamine pyrophosphate-dependent enzyme [Anaeromyxobacteraceae bacterium]|nr:thiamine pyrophosphate-dependent enzyme [Anaeromyxobacteraceae bacterium]